MGDARRGRLYEVDGRGPAPVWLGPLGVLGLMTAISGPVLGIHRNFVW
ncbi:hypothetical protein [Streptomyces sp. NBC_01264]|nr:hypothetical protein [Streptomyces sp. NBC_01264]MCX4779938.1 hypothetical protein [Streptomyces sp. NBC_01264]